MDKKLSRLKQDNLDIGKLPPQAQDVEKSILGAILQMPGTIDKVSEILQPDSFYNDNHSRIYNACLSLKRKNEPIDILTITQELKKTNELQLIGGAYAIVELTNGNISYQIEHHALIVEQKAIQRRMIKFGVETIKLAYEESTDCFELLDQTITNYKSLQPNTKPKKSMMDAYREMFEKAMAAKENGGHTGLQSGIIRLNEKINGFGPKVILIAARPSIGKSALAKSIVLSIIKQKKKVKWFSLEVPADMIITNLIAEEFNIPNSDILKGNVDFANWQRHEKFRDEYIIPYLDIDDTAGVTIQYIEPRIKKAKEEGCELVVIDYIQLMNVNKYDVPPTMREQQVAFLSKNIVRLKSENKIPILVLCQLNRESESRKDKKPQLSDLRESSALEMDAEVVILIHRPEFYGIFTTDKGTSLRGKAKLIIAKHRGGPLGVVNCNYEGQYTKFSDEDSNNPLNLISQEDDMPF